MEVDFKIKALRATQVDSPQLAPLLGSPIA